MSDEDDAWAAVPPLDDGSDGPSYDDPPAPPYDEDQPAPERDCCGLPLNDYGNGQRFKAYFGENLMWVPRVGWFTWTGQVWRKDPDEIAVRSKAQRLGEMVVREIPWIVLDDWQMQALGKERDLRDEMAALVTQTDDDGKLPKEADARLAEIRSNLNAIADLKKTLGVKRKEHRSFARTTGNTARIDAAMKEGSIGLAVDLDRLDAAPLQVNTESGLLEFDVWRDPDRPGSKVASVRVLPHDRAQLMTKMMPAIYREGAECPQFLAFLERVMPAAEMRRFLQRWFGLSMTALVGEQKLVFFYGSGANGKSVLVDLMARMMGDYAATAKIESLTGKNRRGGGDATPDLIPLINARMVRTSEPDEGERFQEGFVKELTGGEPIQVRALHSDFVEVRPVFKLTISGNHKPEIRGTDDGIWRRVLLVPFDVQIPEAERDATLGEKLWAEREGILQWMVDGLIDYLERGLQEPEMVLDATREFREESDPVGAFLEACCICTGHELDVIPSKDLAMAFNFWLDGNGQNQWKSGTVTNKLSEKSKRWKSPTTGRGFEKGKSSSTVYRGIKFNDFFGRRFEDQPRDQHGRLLMGRTAGDE